MFHRLPPAGNPILPEPGRDAQTVLDRAFMPSAVYYFASGAAALAAALKAVVSLSGKSAPEVLLPAYACPELVSAVLFAGARPVLVDFAPDRPWLNLDDLAARLNQHSVAVIAVALFGIPERLAQIREVIGSTSVRLIEDDAQRYPECGKYGDAAGDVIIYSFGRGKPVSVLGGGVALVNDSEIAAALADWVAALERQNGSAVLQAMKIRLYNLLLSPYCYWLPAALPFLHLGETAFRPLPEIALMNQATLDLLPANLQAASCPLPDRQLLLTTMLADLATDAFIDLAAQIGGAGLPRLLRYPLLAKTASLRDRAFDRLDRAGLGVSKLYPTTLPYIAGLETLLADQGPFPGAEDFAARLLTLPTHQGVRPRHVQAIKDTLQRLSRS